MNGRKFNEWAPFLALVMFGLTMGGIGMPEHWPAQVCFIVAQLAFYHAGRNFPKRAGAGE